MILPIDLLLLCAESLERFVASTADVTISADRIGTGTNALFLKGAAAIHFPFRYGRNSFYRHCELSRANRHELRVVDDLTLALDLDQPDDLALVPIVVANARRRSDFSRRLGSVGETG
jgi:2-phospho-L-lactate guanylyltransferase